MENVKYYGNFRENVRLAMHLQGHTTRSVAKLLGTSPAYVSNVLTGKNVPSLDRCEEFSQVLNVSLERLLKDPKRQNVAK